MNRIVLVGNGFDLAHGLKTSYADFIDWYWENKAHELQDVYSDTLDDKLSCLKVHESNWYAFILNHSLCDLSSERFWKNIRNSTDNIECKSYPFFDFIQKEYEEKGWVDIENAYYQFLTSEEIPIPNLNIELNVIKQKLIRYLSEIQKENKIKYLNEVYEKITEPFKKDDISVNSFEIFEKIINTRLWSTDVILKELIGSFKHLNFYYDLSNIHKYKESGRTIENLKTDIEFPKELLLPDKIMLLNFNYTNIADNYFSNLFSDKIIINHIHGSLDKPDSVIFGYGDERDELFNVLQKRKDIESLRNIKTMRYLETPNYKNMLAFIESAPYQVLIMGHSCGQSDGTLLNTIFEHKNCFSIKPYYYKKPDGTDNYMELIQNISRNFTDMKLMRDRVVNKTQCEPLQ